MASAPSTGTRMLRMPSRLMQIIQSEPAAHAAATSPVPSLNRRPSAQMAKTPDTPIPAAVARNANVDSPAKRNTPATR